MSCSYRPIPQRIDWPLLIKRLRRTYSRGDGGLSHQSGIHPAALSRGSKAGIHSWQSGVQLWNLACERLPVDELQQCIINDKLTKAQNNDKIPEENSEKLAMCEGNLSRHGG